MSNAASLTPAFSPLDLDSRPLAWRVGAVVLGTLFLALSSYVEVPMVPVPVTMQTFAVMLVGALYGWRLGALTIIAWLAEAAVGLPVLSGGAAGAHHFVGPTAGYLFAFPVAGALVGWLAERGWNGRKPVLAFVSMLLGNALCLAIGGAWLAVLFGADVAWTSGVAPFIVGGVLKSVLGAALLALLVRGKPRAA
ncbi:biotin biosynthesis protein BioY [Devosia insulae DS-56]|uniref:Biotin transporter n=1 Tax=Devosia insulae DS-56 TaxID=1116389 RepID=A0A1E5XH56_9HYPH|nr:biotin transporter BioY [Devosia insulae]OEO27930.1 biotin biosynthesis protein BioY [Devosia insulae DS-56]